MVDGYNIIFAWKKLSELAADNLDAARQKLADILCNYQGFVQNEVILVFDGYKTKRSTGSVMRFHNIEIVFTKEGQTADQYIEMLVQNMARQHIIKVATSDGMEQIMILGNGASRISARELQIEIEMAEQKIREINETKRLSGRNRLFDGLPPHMAELMEKMRLTEDDK